MTFIKRTANDTQQNANAANHNSQEKWRQQQWNDSGNETNEIQVNKQAPGNGADEDRGTVAVVSVGKWLL